MTLEELKEQRKIIDRQIRELEKANKSYGCIELNTRFHSGHTRWFLKLKSQYDDDMKRLARSWPIVCANNKADIIPRIDTIIADLEGMKQILRGING